MSLSLTDVRALAEGIDRLGSWLRRQLPPQLSISSMSALDRLLREGPLRVSELAAREAMTQPGVTVLTNRLAGAGYAERVADPTDRRAALVRITAAGEALLAERRSARAAMLRARLGELSESDREVLVAALPAIEHLLATTGDAPTGDAPTGDAPTGDAPTDNATAGDATTGDAAISDAATISTGK